MSDIHLLAAFIIGTFSSARLTRLLVHDSLPPIVRLRNWYIRRTERKGYVDPNGRMWGWDLLFRCHWCMSFWTTILVAGLWFALAALGWHEVWWLGNGIMTAWYMAGIIVEHDDAGPADDH